MKRIGGICLLMVIAALLFVGCGGEKGPLKVFIWEQMDPKEQVQLDRHLASFMAANPDILVERVHYETEQLRTQFQNAALAGGGPELIYGPADQVGPFSIMGIIEPLESLFSQTEVDSFNAESLVRLARPGEESPHLWCLPDQLGNHLTLCYNKSYIQEPPTSIEEMIRLAKRNTIDTNADQRMERYGLVFNHREPFWLVPFLGAYGGWVMDDKGNPTLDTPAMVKALELLRGFKVEGITPRECDYDLAEALFKEGKAAFIINGPWSWQGYIDAGIDLGLTPIPQLAETGLWPTPMVSVKGYCLNVNSRGESREAALLLMRHLTSEISQDHLAAELGVIPSRRLAAGKAGAGHPLIGPSLAQIEHGRAMPVVAEMRAIWDVTRPELQAVLGMGKDPAEAARDMQAAALTKIAEMKGE
ncbi:MAG: extracellular solute-binding protein [bacterium]|nr:extracellular solute-binding protein [bacterium]